MLDRVCRQCHTDGGPASRRFDDWAAAYDQRQPMLTQVDNCWMPPDDAPVALTDDERRLLLEWLVCGAPE